jgi:hypothetical protein
MGDIYANAKRVIVWLGVGTEESDLGFKYIQKLARVLYWWIRIRSSSIWLALLNRTMEQMKKEAKGVCCLLNRVSFFSN